MVEAWIGCRRTTCMGVRLDLGRMIQADRQGVGQAEGRPKAELGLRGVEIGIGRAGVFGVGLARFALAGRGHVVDVLERAPQSLRPVFGPDHDVQADQRHVAFRTDDMARGERLGDVDDIGVFDHVIARPDRRRVRRGERAPGGLDRDRAYRQLRRVVWIGQVLAQAPAGKGKRRVLGFVDARFVAGIGAVLRHQRIGGHAGQERGLIEIHEGLEGGERLLRDCRHPLRTGSPLRRSPMGAARSGARPDRPGTVHSAP